MEEFDYIYRNFTSGLSEAEKEIFNALLRSDAVFREKVADYQLIFEGFKCLQHEWLFNKIQSWGKELLIDNRIEEIETIRRYLSGAMKAKERAGFEDKLRKDPDLENQLTEYRPILEGLKAMQVEAFNEQAKGWLNELNLPPKPEKKPVIKLQAKIFRYAVAAVIAVCLGFFGLKWYAFSNYSTDALVMQNYHPRSTPATLSSQEDLLQAGYNAYKEKDLNKAIDFFSQIPDSNPRYAEAQLFLGYANFEASKFPEAAQAFQTVISTKDQRFADNAEWHLLLVYLKEDPSGADFTALLERLVSDNEHSFHDEALNLKASMSSFWRKLTRE